MLKRFRVSIVATSFVLVSLAAATAQPMPMGGRAPDPRGGITVSGAGQASAPADEAQVTLQIMSRGNQMTLNAETLKPVAQALERAGADPKTVSEPIYLSGPAKSNYATIGATVQHPTPEMLQSGMLTLSQAFAQMPDLAVQEASVNLTIHDCSALRSKARRAALSQAHAQAADIAEQTHVSLGRILAVQSFGDGGGMRDRWPNGCTSGYQLRPGFSPQFNSPADYLQVRIFVNLTATYSIH